MPLVSLFEGFLVTADRSLTAQRGEPVDPEGFALSTLTLRILMRGKPVSEEFFNDLATVLTDKQ
jgi:hypothetical protein